MIIKKIRETYITILLLQIRRTFEALVEARERLDWYLKIEANIPSNQGDDFASLFEDFYLGHHQAHVKFYRDRLEKLLEKAMKQWRLLHA